MSNDLTVAEKMATEVGALIKARNPIIWVVSPEERRVERALVEIAGKAGYTARLWDCVEGVTDILGADNIAPGRSATDPEAVFEYIRKEPTKAVWIMRDLAKPFLTFTPVLRRLRNLARFLPSQKEGRIVVVLSTSAEIPPDLQDHVAVVKWDLPDRTEIGRIFDTSTKMLEGIYKTDAEAVRELAIEAAVGLTAEGASSCYAKSLVTQKMKIVPSIISAEKKRVVSGKGIEWIDPDPRGLDAVGGLAFLKAWLQKRVAAYSERARAYGLPKPKGVLLAGLPGGGKSLSAKAVAAAWQVPLLKLDLGGARSKWVGESEENIRKVLSIADTVGNCVLWIDEIEKALGGATNGAADGGVSTDALGVLLSWMQDHKGGAFVIATANEVRNLPPELLRKGRFDELFFVDLPTHAERCEILRVALKEYNRDASTIDVIEVAKMCKDFVGAEIAAIVPAALYTAFADGERQITTEDLLTEARVTVPLAKTAQDKIENLRKWASTNARAASAPEVMVEGFAIGERNLDLES